MAKKLNLIMSSWPSAGGTTTALILAGILELKYIYAGGVLKEWAKRMGYDPSSDAFHRWEEKYGDDWDMIWEEYIKRKLSQDYNFLYEGKTAGFLLPQGIAYEIMVTARPEVRAQRASGDQRTETLVERDKFLQKRWKKEFGFDLLSTQDIKRNYNLHLDNSDLSILEATIQALTAIKTYCEDQKIEISDNFDEKHIAEIELNYWQLNKKDGSGKTYLQNILKDKGLLVTNEEIFADFHKISADLISKLPQEMAEATKNGSSS